MSATDWQSWCRLCAGVDGKELKLDTIESVSKILHHYIQISLSISKECISVVCQDCLDMVLDIEKFVLRLTKVNNMFMELLNENISIDNVDLVRQQYGLSINDEMRKLDAKECLPLSTPSLDIVELPKMLVNSDLFRTETELTDAVSFSDEQNYDGDDVYNHPNPIKSKKESKSAKRKRSTKPKATQSIANKRKEINDSKPRTKRKQVKGTDVWCHLCDTTFDLPRLYMEHMRGKHTPDVLPFVCSECPKFFASEKKLRQHSASHRPIEQKKVHPCPECDRTFTRTENVTLHIRVVHMGERPFVCEECGKSWATKGALKQHQITHTEARPFKCSECTKFFKDSYSLKKHSEIHNTVSFECFLCGQQLNTRYTLREHMLVHSDEKRYKCQYCGNAYKRYPALKDHLNIHTGIRFSCPFCDVSYADRSNLRTHKKKCHPVESAAMKANETNPGPVIQNVNYLLPN